MSCIVKRRRGDRVYYEEVENVRVDGKPVQRFIRYIGTSPDAPPRKFSLEPRDSAYLALSLAAGTLTANEVFEILEQQGQRFSKESLDRIGLVYSFGEKTCSLSLYYTRRSRPRRGARSAGKGSGRTRPGRGG